MIYVKFVDSSSMCFLSRLVEAYPGRLATRMAQPTGLSLFLKQVDMNGCDAAALECSPEWDIPGHELQFLNMQYINNNNISDNSNSNL